MITRVTKPPTITRPMRKPVNTGGKARAAQLPKTSSNRSSFAFQSQSSASIAGSTKHRTGGTINLEPKSVTYRNPAMVAGKSQQNRFNSPKSSHSNGFGLSKTATVQHESHKTFQTGKELSSPCGGSYYRQGGTTGR